MRTECVELGCTRKIKSRGLCGLHYGRWRREHPELVNGNYRKGSSLTQTERYTWQAWVSMRARCLQPGIPGYKSCGGRGIQVDARWGGADNPAHIDAFPNFFADMGRRPEGYALRRKNLNLNFTPENCYWGKMGTTEGTSIRETISGITGVYWRRSKQRWIAQISFRGDNRQLGSYTTLEEAVAAREKAVRLRDSGRWDEVDISTVQSKAKHGLAGISYRKDKNTWMADIHINTQIVHLGSFRTKEEAWATREKADKLKAEGKVEEILAMRPQPRTTPKLTV
jgi:hypothetical protein